MRLRTRIILPSILFMLLLVSLGTAQLYLNNLRHEEDEKIEALKEKLLTSSDIISEKIELHFKTTLEVLIKIEVGEFRGDIKEETGKLKQIEINTLSYLLNLKALLNGIEKPFVTTVDEINFQILENDLREYFSITRRALLLMPKNHDHADIVFARSAELSINTRATVREITRQIEEMLLNAAFSYQSTLSVVVSVLWWIAFAGAFTFSLAFAYFSNSSAYKIQNLIDKFTKLFPDADLQKNIRSVGEGFSQLEWLAESLAKTRGELHASQEQLDQIISNSSIAIFVHRHMKPLFANRAVLELCGFENEADFKRMKSTTEFFAPHEHKRVTDLHEARLRGEPTPNLYETELLRTDGTSRWALNKSFSIDWDGEVAICTTLIDITDRINAERRLSDSEDRFNELLQLTPDPIYIHSLTGEILNVNEAACQALGYDHNEILRKNIEDFAHHNEEEKSQFFWKNESASGSLIKSVQTFHVRKDGSRFPVEVNITSGILDGQKVILAMAHDMTETMEHIEELDNLRKKAEEASKAKSEFLSMMSHELRTPLNSIIGYSELYLQSTKGHEGIPKEAGWIEQVKASGENLLAIIDKVLDLITIDKEFETHIDTSSDLITHVNSVLDVYQNEIDDRNITLVKNFPENMPVFINASDKALYIIVENLITNAIKFNSYNGSIYFSIKDHSPISYELSVQDTGGGIDREDIAKAFVPFNRLGHENGPIAGNGIGLTLVQKIAEYIGANVNISSPKEGGCCFTVILPKALIT